MKTFFFYLGMTAGFGLPLFNIPLILRIVRNRSSKDISLTWAVGAWSCILLMTPQAVLSTDWSFKIFGIVNVVLFTLVLFYVFRYRKGGG